MSRRRDDPAVTTNRMAHWLGGGMFAHVIGWLRQLNRTATGHKQPSVPVTVQRLRAALITGQVVRIRYREGSQPGPVREIYLIDVGDHYCLARDMTGNEDDKTLKIDRIEILDGEPVTYIDDFTPQGRADDFQTPAELAGAEQVVAPPNVMKPELNALQNSTGEPPHSSRR